MPNSSTEAQIGTPTQPKELPLPTKAPAAMATERRWVVWQYDYQKLNGEGKPSKPPVNPTTGFPISSTDTNNWLSFDEAVAAARTYKRTGVGFVLGGGWSGVDFDGHVTDGVLSDEANVIVLKLNSYTEVSPSGTGAHTIVKADSPDKVKDKEVGLEVYGGGQYFAFTGNAIKGFPDGVMDRPEEFRWVVENGVNVLRAMRGLPGKGSNTQPQQKEADRPAHWKHYTATDIERALDRLGIEYAFKEEYGTGRVGWSLRHRCLFSDDHTDGCYISFGPARPGAICHHASCEGKGWKEAEEILWPDENPAKKSLALAGATIHWLKEIAEPLPAVEWVVDRLVVPRSVNAIYGAPGTKKTYTALTLGVCIAAGIEFLGRRTRQGTVLIMDEESGFERIHRRLREIALGLGIPSPYDLPLAFVSYADFDLTTQNDRERFGALVGEIRPLYCVADALADFMTGSEDKKEFTHPVFKFIRQVADRHGTAFDVLHHATKSNGSIRGSSAIPGAVDRVLKMSSKNRDSYVLFDVEKNRDGAPERFAADAVWDDDENGETVFTLTPTGVRGGTTASPLSDKQQFLLDIIATEGGSLQMNLREQYDPLHSNGNERSLRVALEGMAAKNIIRNDGGRGEKTVWLVNAYSGENDHFFRSKAITQTGG